VFDSVGGHPRQNLAALDARTGTLLAWTTPNAPEEIETTFAVRRQVMFYGHHSWDVASASTGRSLAWPSGVNGVAGAFVADGPLLYLGGGLPSIITSVDGHQRNNPAVYNLPTGQFTSWAPNLAPYVDISSITPSGDAC
jgi:hypothetical protein